MNMKKLLLPISIAAILGVQAEAMAAEYWLCAKPVTIQLPKGGKKLGDGSQDMKNVIMWGIAEPTGTTAAAKLANFNAGCSGPVRTPGPRLNVPAGDSTLIVHLKNAITVVQGGEPISLQIPGQAKPTVTGATSTSILGFGEAASGATAAAGGVVNYTWTNFKTGTFAYESGSHPQHQIPMGLYGVSTHDFADHAVYQGAPYAYDNEAILVYSEVDPALYRHQNGSNATQMQVPTADRYGAGSAVASSINYKPEFYLINGKPFGMGDKVNANSILNNLFVGAPADLSPVGKTLLRLVNVGLQTHVPNMLGLTGAVLAEDGNPYPYPKGQHAITLPAGSTRDVLIDTPTAGIVPLIDRMGGLSAGDPTITMLDPDISPKDLAQARPDAGMLAKVQFGVANPAAANPNAYTVNEGQANYTSSPAVIANDQLGDYTGHGTLEAVIDSLPAQGNLTPLAHTDAQSYVLLPTGLFRYSNNATHEFGNDSFQYHVKVVANGSGPELAGSVLYESAPTTVTINVNHINDVPVANLNYYVAVRNPGSLDPITAPGSSFLVERIGAAAPFTYPVPTDGILANDTDVDGPTPLLVNSFTPVTQTGGALSVNNSTGAVTFTPTVATPIVAGSRTFTYTTRDSNTPTPGVSAARTGNTLQVVINTAPTRCTAVTPICTSGAITTPQARITPLSTPVSINMSTWFTDAQLVAYGSIFGLDWSTLACDVTVAPANATVSTDGAGTVTFTPTATGTKTYNCWVKDTQGLPTGAPTAAQRVQVTLTVN